ncbi:MAG: C39 family peptidase [Candidatus Eisenbacteria bacterium]|uniref:C39 family peptidase n=1 Tax=Eiseniibacteriota bacterium TaxID=2212470 RepID=A0A948S1A8_UNCEI|nr:C39 family peptidase [Candidatus Eisenbacteria bacterium]MBU1949649.1 C39 family peptidase [Candidatus Eisenbacteria bacterium]MBU2693042.1 C39 family peptidase [Candidatus Eisenbacteria bacterium]
MKDSKRVALLLTLALMVFVFIILAPGRGAAKFLSVPVVGQEQTNWCWAACTEAVLDYYAISAEQCDIANAACSDHSPSWCSSCVSDPDYCCNNPGHATCCNKSNCMYGAPGCLADLLATWGLGSAGYAGVLSLSTIRNDINVNCRPIIINWYWTAGGGHYIVGRGVTSDNMIYYMNPLPVGSGGYHIASYNWVVDSSDHSWEFSLRMVSGHYCPGPDVVVCEPQGGSNPNHPTTYWYDVTPTTGGRCDVHLETFDPNSNNYTNWVLPNGWFHYIFNYDGKYWICMSNPGCAHPITTTTRLQFDNPYGARWGMWVTGTSGG